MSAEKNEPIGAEGVKIRRQYFTAIVCLHAGMALWLPYLILIVSASLRKLDVSEWLCGIGFGLLFLFLTNLPFLILAILNRLFFGRTVCTVCRDGIRHEGGFLPWKDIRKIEYTVDYPRRYRVRFCRAVVYTEKDTVTLLHAPLYLLSAVRKIRPDIETRIAKESIFMGVLILSVLLILPLLLPLLPI